MDEIIKKYNFEKKIETLYQVWLDDFCCITLGINTKMLRFTFGPNNTSSFIYKKYETAAEVEKLIQAFLIFYKAFSEEVTVGR